MCTKNKRVSMTIERATILLGTYDSWAGSFHPDDREEYLAIFNNLRSKLDNHYEQLLKKDKDNE